ncbi:aminotransferase class I/II-fold pyridoxal phosphate-dependent enzyme [Aliibacillus thermotolerans]|uniref:Aminotransferase class I/II-fold pyridoxal phosphate-dependent enzyme n=1 Tax=Aliibacillus thermotolerans TaxID=1834418 RepID=A0ABW0U8W1_9BACI|nr:aminotransferase class I/II-fold pyridoxal phosphate-dependent enzyme [Aliibacillus thermotolerans]MDA3128881.1 aminotransferase class I/II-fold pyridoxal phosphate-dependent enzyme [Aliibacillus thermotolerans]
MDQEKMPLLQALENHLKRQPVSFHVPGHKNGTLFPPTYGKYFKEIAAIDQTELTGLDDLHDPTGPIQEAQMLTAELFGAVESIFLVGGSTSGNLAMIMGAFREGETVLVQRDVHKSVINGLRLANARPVFIFPEYEESSHLSLGLSVDKVKEAFLRYPEAKGLIITSPTYYGWTPPLEPIIQVAKAYDAIVLVDEAHGAHFVANDCFPSSALAAGADVVVQSAHKTLPALTMGAYLHIGTTDTNLRQSVKEKAALIQSSSPSYPIMASLDLARKYVYDVAKIDKHALRETLVETSKRMERETGLKSVTPPAPIKRDLLKCVLQAPTGYSGWTFARYLEANDLYPELADNKHVLLILPLSIQPLSTTLYEKIKVAVTKMKKEVKRTEFPNIIIPSFDLAPFDQLSVPIKEQMDIPLEKAYGKRTATDLIPYPPGIPLFFKGELLTGKRYEALIQWLRQGGRVQGGLQDDQGKWFVPIIQNEG